MNYTYKVNWKKGKEKDETGVISGPNGFSMAVGLAKYWLASRGGKSANILRADCSGLNAGKFFLHLIVKA